MATLLSNVKLGNTGVSGLLKSANTLANQIQNNQDQAVQDQWTNSAKTATDFQAYIDYFQNRVNTLSAAGSASDIGKAQTYSQRLVTANRAYISAEITRQTSNVMEGNASLYDKMNVMQNFYNIASDPQNGDPNLAQSLRGRMDSLNIEIQNAQIAAAKSAKDINDANQAALKAGYDSAISQAKSDWANIASMLHSGNEKAADTAMAAFVKNNANQYKALTGQDLPKGAQLTPGSLLQATFNMEFAYNQQAATALRPYDPVAADKYATYDANGNIVGGEAYKILSNQSYVNVPGVGNMNASDATAWAQNPGQFELRTNKLGQTEYGRNPVTGFRLSATSPEPLTINNEDVANQMAGMNKNQKAQMKKQLETAGFTVNKINSDGSIEASFTGNTDKWTQFKNSNLDLASSSRFGKGNSVTLIPQANGSFQFVRNNNAYILGFDVGNRAGIFRQVINKPNAQVAGQYGFNNQVNTAVVANLDTQLHQVINHVVSQTPSMMQRQGGGFNFTDAQGNPISALTYSKMTGTAFRNVLSSMAAKGDTYAAQALRYAGNDAAYNPAAIPLSVATNWQSLVWGNRVNLQIPQAARVAGGSSLNYFQNLTAGGGQNIAAPNGLSVGHL